MTSFWQEKNVLITGFDGFVGSQVAEELVNRGANVTGIVRRSVLRNSEFMKYCAVISGDVRDYKFMCEAISSTEAEIVYHFAANAIVRISSQDPMSTYDVNVMGTVALLEAARNVGKVKRLVVASSDKAYGDHEDLPYTEAHHHLIPKNTYDTSKACMDMIARSYAHNYGLPIVVTRCSNIYGPGDLNLSRLVPGVITRLLSGQAPLLYSDISEMEREFIYIHDVINAYERLGRVDGVDGQAFNIGGTGPIKILDMAKLICEVMGKDVSPKIVERDSKFKEIKRQYIDASLLCEKTGWEPRVSLRQGLEQTAAWYDAWYDGVRWTE